MPPYIAKQDKTSEGITPYDVNTPMSARKGLPSRASRFIKNKNE